MATISPQRLEALRAMSTSEYLATPEWQATQKHILERDHYQCQGCHAVDVLLHVHHYTYTRQGCELDDDVVTLCEVCRDELHRLMADPPKLSFLKQWGLVGLGTAAIGTIGMEGFVRAPFPAEIGVLIVAFVLAKQSPAIYGKLKEKLSPEILAWLGHAPTSRKTGKPSFLDIWLARTPKRQAPEEDVSTIITDRPDIREASDEEDEEESDAKPWRPTITGVGSIIGSDPRLRLDLAPNFQPDANDPLATGIFIVGCSGSGKTVTLVRFAEQYIKLFQLGCMIFDSQGDWKSLVEDGFCPNGIIATPENMPSMAEVVAKRLQVVVDLDEWHAEGKVGINWEMAGKMTAAKIQELMAVQKQIDPDDRIPCPVIIDEVHLFVPQTAPSYLTKETARSLLDTVVALATTGRKLGTPPFLATQRIAKVNKDVIGQMETRLFGKVDLDNDLTRYRDYIPTSVVTDDQLRTFHKGEMVVCFNGKRIIAQFHHRETRHISHTPRIPLSTYHQHAVGPDAVAQRRREREWNLHGTTSSQARLRIVRPGVGTDRDGLTEPSEAEMRDRGLVPEEAENGQKSAFSASSGTRPRVPRMHRERPVAFVPRSPQDKIVPNDKLEDLAHFYGKHRDVKKALGEIGLGHRYFNHANWILEQRGLKARKA